MRRLVGILALAALAAEAQMVPNFQFRYKCSKSQGKAIIKPCRGPACKHSYYCWDGEIYSNSPGYDPPPSHVLAYWEASRKRSQEIEANVTRASARLDEAMQRHRIEKTPGSRNRSLAITGPYRVPGTRPSIVYVESLPASPTTSVPVPAPPSPPIERGAFGAVKTGMTRADVETLIGKPHGVTSIQDSDGLIESLTYNVSDAVQPARIRIERGKVASIHVP